MQYREVVITLHVPTPRTARDREVEQRLRDLAVAHNVCESDAVVGELPAIEESGRVVGPADLDVYLDELQTTLAQWRKFQTDACYVEDDGIVC
ncbi:MAG: hypothetical protein KDB69_05860 [Acidimicrobiia bacterium]|nr:hypothetical protein [Acidimicrobiia bacterium]